MSLQTGTLDSRSLAYFSCRPAASSDYYPTVFGEWALVFFFFPPLPVCSYWDVIAGCVRRLLLLLLLMVTGGRIVCAWLSFLCAIKKAWFGEMAYFLIQSLTIEHTVTTNCIILAFTSTFSSALMVVSLWLFPSCCINVCIFMQRRASCTTIVWPDHHFFFFSCIFF